MKIEIEKEKNLKKSTEERLEKLQKEFSKELTSKVFENTYGYNQIIAQVEIPFYALCEHHKVGFEGECSIAYIPDKFLLGLSKLGRIVEYFLNPIVETTQEKATHRILETMKKIKPKGIMVIIKAKHTCVCYRGVKKPSLTITSAVDGAFKDNFTTRQEFLSLIK